MRFRADIGGRLRAPSEVPSVVRRGGQRNVTVEALANSGVDRYDIPAFLRNRLTERRKKTPP